MVYEGSNRAKCKFCDKKIKEGETQVNAYGYQTSGNVHLKCLVELAHKKGLKWQE